MPEPVRIRTAADLFRVLTEGSFLQQAAVLKSISDDPSRALALGKHEGEDFLDLLVRLIPESDGGIKKLQLFCLSLYDDPRTTTFMLDEFERARDAASILHLGRRLSLDREPQFFRRFLWRDDKPAQSLVAARLLSGSEDLQPAERLRIAIVLDREFEPPPLGPDTLDLWLGELSGRHRLRVRLLAEGRGGEVLHFWNRYDSLPEEEREWLLALTARLDPALARRHLGRFLEDAAVSWPTVRQARDLGLDLPPRLLANRDERVRAAAVEAGLADDRVEEFLSASVPEAVAAAGRCPTTRLLDLLADPRWQVRAKAAETLGARPQPPLQELRCRTRSELEGERIAALEALLQAGDEAWLAEHVARPPTR